MYSFFSELNDFKNDLETSKYFIDEKNYWLSILFMGNFIVNKLKAIAMLLNIPTSPKNILEDIKTINLSILIVDKDFGIPKKTLSSHLVLIEKTKSEKNALFEKDDLISMLEGIQVFSDNIKKLLTEGKGV